MRGKTNEREDLVSVFIKKKEVTSGCIYIQMRKNNFFYHLQKRLIVIITRQIKLIVTRHFYSHNDGSFQFDDMQRFLFNIRRQIWLFQTRLVFFS